MSLEQVNRTGRLPQKPRRPISGGSQEWEAVCINCNAIVEKHDAYCWRCPHRWSMTAGRGCDCQVCLKTE